MAAWYFSYHAIFIIAILALGKLSRAFVNADHASVREAVKYERRLDGVTVYDVSNVIDNSKNANQTEILPETLYTRDINTSAYYYYTAHGAAYFEDCWREGWDYKCEKWMIKGISVMFGDKAKKGWMLPVTDASTGNSTERNIKDTFIINSLKMNNSIIDSVTILIDDHSDCSIIPLIFAYLDQELNIKNYKDSVKFGLEYNHEFLERCAEELFPQLESLQHTVLRIHLTPLSTMLSYEILFERVKKLIEKNRDFIRKFNPECAPYIRIHTEDMQAPVISLDKYERYDALMTKYLLAFSKQTTGNEVYIFRPISKRIQFAGTRQFFWQSVMPGYSGDVVKNTNNADGRKLSPCEHQHVVKIMMTNSRNIRVYDPNLGLSSLLSDTCQQPGKIARTHLSLPKNSSLSLSLDSFVHEFESVVKSLVQSVRGRRTVLRFKRVYFGGNLSDRTGHLVNLSKLLKAENIDVGCSTRDFKGIENGRTSALIGDIAEQCGALFNLSSTIILEFRLNVIQKEELLSFLMRLHLAKQYFQKLYPDKSLVPNLHLFVPAAMTRDHSSLYCDSKVKAKNLYHETVMSFANIHQWSGLGIRAYEHGTIWSYAETDEEIDRYVTNFPVLFRTNAPRSADQDLPMTYACIQGVQNANQSNISFMENGYSGATFPINLRKTPLSMTELETSVQLAMKHFPSLELIADSQKEFIKLHKVISKVDLNSHSYSNISGTVLYVDVPLREARGLREDILSFLSNNRTGLHVSNWESLSHKQLNIWKDFAQSSTLNFGVTVQNCSHEMNSRLATLTSLPFISQVKYVLCNAKPVSLGNLNLNGMNNYLGTLFYTKSYMERYLSSQNESGKKVEVMFRLNFICVKKNETEKFLTFLNDLNQHSAAYKIRYFLVRAFDPEHSSANCSNSWWRLDSYADLTNLNAYVNRQDEYTGRHARIELQYPVNNSNTIYFIIFIPIVVFLLLAILAIWVHHQRMKTRFLTAKEINQFYNGGGDQAIVTATEHQYLDATCMKFPKHYQIPLKDIQVGDMIGSGQFGVVHRGILSKRIEVAIKVPRADCGKDQFKSTLAELKILCYIGEHLNIVHFLGAHTKDIAIGKLHIVLEYCRNGCLLNHLRQSRETEETTSPFFLFRLFGFSHQIASGMEYIAGKRVIHGDLAARNVLLTAELTCKIADFGLSRRLYEMSEYVKSSQEPLPWRWMAPESLRDMEFTVKSDVWSYGVTLWEIFSLGMVPYPGMNWTVNYVTELENGMRMEKALHANDNIHVKTLECWNGNPEARPTFTELVEYFAGLRNEHYLILDHN